MIDLIPASVIAIDDQDLAIVNVIADGLDQGLVIVKIDMVKNLKEQVELKVYINTFTNLTFRNYIPPPILIESFYTR